MRKKKTELRFGMRVTWESQAQGSTTRKEGTIVRVIREDEARATSPLRIANAEFPGHQKMFDGRRLPGGGSIGCLVEVRDGKTDKARPKLYMPYPGKLKLSAG